MNDFLSWMEASTLGRVMRQAGPWAYAITNVAHVFGVATLFGSILVLDLRLLGVWQRVPLAPLAAAIRPTAVVGFCLAAASGVCLLATTATDYDGNPFLLIKFPAIAVGLLNVAAISRTQAWRAREVRELSDGEQRQLARLGGLSLACWVTAVVAGRLIAYW